MEGFESNLMESYGKRNCQPNIKVKNQCVKGEEQMDIKKILSLVGCLAELYKILSEEDL